MDAASHLEHRDVVLSVDLVGGRVEPAALLHVLVEDAAALHVAEAELAQVELRQSGGRGREWGFKSQAPVASAQRLRWTFLGLLVAHLLYSCG